jgi:hypothetical protein
MKNRAAPLEWLPVLIIVVTGGIFLLDMLKPAGALLGAAYVVPVIACLWLRRPAADLIAGGCCAVLALTAFAATKNVRGTLQMRADPGSSLSLVTLCATLVFWHKRSDVRQRVIHERLAGLNEVANTLGRAQSLDEMCRAAVELGRERLGFSRLGIWFLDGDVSTIRGTFGVDEHARLRDERDERIHVEAASAMGGC